MVTTMHKKPVSTKKPRVAANVDESIKADAEELANIRRRSLSNLIETLLVKEIEEARKSGELPARES